MMKILSGFQYIAARIVKIVFDVRHILIQVHLLIQRSVFLGFDARLSEIFIIDDLVYLGVVVLDKHHSGSEKECRWVISFDEGKCLLVSVHPANIDPREENSYKCCIS